MFVITSLNYSYTVATNVLSAVQLQQGISHGHGL